MNDRLRHAYDDYQDNEHQYARWYRQNLITIRDILSLHQANTDRFVQICNAILEDTT
jgi:hypothetical protein